ncbi:MAG: oligosaccharide flippase family protein [Erysipelotrichaceae bacterium]
MTRKENVFKNIRTSVIGEVIHIALGFITRGVFLKILGTEYLGINTLFADIVDMLALTELGIGSSIIFSMYKPINDRDEKRICALMHFFKTVYRYIALAITIFGLAIMPFLSGMMKEVPQDINIYLLFGLYLCRTIASYLFAAYKAALIRADQKVYVLNRIYNVYIILTNIVQIVVLYVTKDFVLYTASFIVSNILQNIYIARTCDKMYPFSKDKDFKRLDKAEQMSLFKDASVLFMYEVNNKVYNSVDNIILSRFIGLAIVGVYSNYMLVVSNIKKLMDLVFNSLASSIGNLNVTSSNERKMEVFFVINYFCFIAFGVVAIGFMNCVNPFIEVWLGRSLLLPMGIVFVKTVELYIYGINKNVVTFRHNMGLFRFKKYMPLYSALLHIVLALVLVRYWGLFGVVIATLVSILTTLSVFDPIIVFRNGFNTSPVKFFGYNFYYIFIMIVCALASNYLCSLVPYGGFIQFVICGIISVMVTLVIMVVFTFRQREFKYLVNIIKKDILKLG